MAQKIFTFKYVVILTMVLIASSVGTFLYLPAMSSHPAVQQQSPVDKVAQNAIYDQEVDRALQFSLEGKYVESARILMPLAQKGFNRAQLYLAVAYYHGHGVKRDFKKAEAIFFSLQKKQYEPGIVSTYLNLLGSLPPV